MQLTRFVLSKWFLINTFLWILRHRISGLHYEEEGSVCLPRYSSKFCLAPYFPSFCSHKQPLKDASGAPRIYKSWLENHDSSFIPPLFLELFYSPLYSQQLTDFIRKWLCLRKWFSLFVAIIKNMALKRSQAEPVNFLRYENMLWCEL